MDVKQSGWVRARAPGKVNLHLLVGGVRFDGFHPLATVFHAVELGEVVTVRAAARGSGIVIDEVHGLQGADVPRDRTNLVWRAAELMSAALGRAPDVHISINKEVPVAGGMAGGSADAAAALVALDALWGASLGRSELFRMALELGSDVPFALLGGSAIGLGRGEQLESLPGVGPLHWVFATAHLGLSTPQVYRIFDEVNSNSAVAPVTDREVLLALESGDPVALARVMHNDLQSPVLSLRPELRAVIAAGESAGALRGMVSGSGPTIAFLVADPACGARVGAALERLGEVRSVHLTSGPALGARVI